MKTSILFIVFFSSSLLSAANCGPGEKYCEFLQQYEQQNLAQHWDEGSDTWVRELWRNPKFTGGSYGDVNSFPMLSRFRNSQRVRTAVSELNSWVGILPSEDIKYLSSLYAYDIYSRIPASKVELTQDESERQLLTLLKEELVPCLKNAELSKCREFEAEGLIVKTNSRYSLASKIKESSISPKELSSKITELKIARLQKEKEKRAADIAKYEERKKAPPKNISSSEAPKKTEPQEACYVSPKIEKCSTADYKKIRASSSFKARYQKKHGDIKQKLTAYCRAGIESSKSKATIKPPHFIRRNLAMSGNGFEFFGCKADFVPGEKITCIESVKDYASKNAKANVIPLPFWPAGSSITGFETWTGLDFWDMQSNGELDCNTSSEGLENYYAWACVAENGFPDCFEKDTGFSFPFLSPKTR
jgi:hypothetical protein